MSEDLRASHSGAPPCTGSPENPRENPKNQGHRIPVRTHILRPLVDQQANVLEDYGASVVVWPVPRAAAVRTIHFDAPIVSKIASASNMLRT